MLVPTSARRDRTVAVITVGLDNVNTAIKKKLHCAICGNVVIAYFDTMHIMVPGEEDPEKFTQLSNAVNEVECKARVRDDNGYTNRCRTMYILNRG